ncbi:MAG: hypothetical protein KF805_16840 [Phycisphaeraceae bacterium]|nr:hypothetical protein [Phycisphaeraceae bacterium]
MSQTRIIRRSLVQAFTFVICGSTCLCGCDDPLGGKAVPIPATATAKTNAVELARLCELPPAVTSVEWSTYKIGNDWGLLARVKMPPANVAALMSKMKPSDRQSVFIGSPLPAWLGNDTKIFTQNHPGTAFKSAAPVYQPDLFTKSPLLHGFVVNPAPDTILIGLHTN